MDLLEQEVDALGGHSASIGRGKTREQLQAEVDEAATKAAEIETGKYLLAQIRYPHSEHCFQL